MLSPNLCASELGCQILQKLPFLRQIHCDLFVPIYSYLPERFDPYLEPEMKSISTILSINKGLISSNLYLRLFMFKWHVINFRGCDFLTWDNYSKTLKCILSSNTKYLATLTKKIHSSQENNQKIRLVMRVQGFCDKKMAILTYGFRSLLGVFGHAESKTPMLEN